ncbi:MAG: glycosyltransferase family 2 protein [Dysgonamonadaceae bacterium]|jgi:glycosyltransferase involved in cell wall biosynthesis|nr:glycosyltransferase family 2 protein [Dysgonamonadaceae bacterium]
MDYFFSFVLPAYKEKYLKEAIQSILQQSYTHFELVIVNDASPENLDEIVNSFNDSRIVYHHNEENIGGKNLVKNWNHCLSLSKGDFLILASDDDVYEKDFLSEINRLIALYPDINIYKARTKKINKKNKIIEIDPHFSQYSSLIDFMYNRRKGMISCVSNYVFNNKVLKKAGGFIDFPAAWHSDAATVDFMAKNGIAITNQVLFSFRSSEINISNQKNIALAYSKLQATILYDRWFDENINLQPQNEDEAFLVNQILEKRKTDREYMTYLIVRSFSLFKALIILYKIYKMSFLPKKQVIRLAVKYVLGR